MNEPLPSSEVRRLAKAPIVAGTVIYSDHALSEMAKDKLTKPEVERVLRGGSAGEGEWENGRALVIVTAWRKRR